MLFKNMLLVALGGGVGSVARFLCQRYIYPWHPHSFPVSTFLVNISGCFLIGLLYAMAQRNNWLTPEWRILLTTGFCGGFTTFSTFALEGILLLKNGEWFYFTLYITASVMAGLLAAFGGMWLLK